MATGRAELDGEVERLRAVVRELLPHARAGAEHAVYRSDGALRFLERLHAGEFDL